MVTVPCGKCGGTGKIAWRGYDYRLRRERHGISLRALARATRLSASFVSDVELNRRQPNKRLLAAYEKLR